jgi:predicted  nucleic acid-binding Zn-ribbon protein
MSSSRSIAAARQRRAGEAPPVAQRGPGTSMGSQQAFAQQQMQQQSYSQSQQQSKGGLPPQAPQVPVGKLSLGDAFALVTIRLGRVESIIQKLEAEGVIGENAPVHSSTMEHDENMRLVDDTVIRNIIARLGDLEKSHSKISAQLQQSIRVEDVSNIVAQNIEELQNQMFKLENDLNLLSNGATSENVSQSMTDLQGQVSQLREEFNSNSSSSKGLTTDDVLLIVSQSNTDLKLQLDELRNNLNEINTGFTTDADSLKKQVEQLQNELKEAKEMIESLKSSSSEKN